jgi:hypothetical protein
MPTDLITDAELLQAWPAASSISSGARADLIAAASRRFEGECDRKIGQGTYTETYRPGRTRVIYLREFPVISVSRIAAGFASIASIQWTGAGRGTAEYTGSTSDPDALTFTGIRLTGNGTVSNFAFATYTTLSSLATAVNAVSGWSMVVDADYGSWATTLLSYDVGAQQAKDYPFAVEAYTSDLSFALDRKAAAMGIVELVDSCPDGYRYPDRRWAGRATGAGLTRGGDPRVGSVEVTYTAGYLTTAVPFDIKRAVTMIAAWLHGRVDAAGLQSESAKDYSYTLAQPTAAGAPSEVLWIANDWRRKEVY